MVDNDKCSLSSFTRNRYFYGKLLTTRDFELEQKYGIEKNRLINRLILGEGIVCGLQIQLKEEKREGNSFSLTLTPGVALDCYGREIVVSQTKSEKLEFNSPGKKYIYIKYDEHCKEPIADIANGSAEESGNRYNRVEESYELCLSSVEPEPESKPDLTANSLDERVRQYYDRSLTTCGANKDPKIPLAVVEIDDSGKATLNEKETQNVRPILRSNPMLYELLDRVYDLAKEAMEGSKIDGDRFVSSDESIKIAETEDGEKLDFTVAAPVGEPTSPSRVFTGKRVLSLATAEESAPGSLQPVSVRIEELEEKEPFSVILAPQLPATVPPAFAPTLGEQEGKSGLRFFFGSHPQLPRTYVAYVPQPYNKTFEIHGCDPNLSELNLQQVEVVYWVITGAKTPSLRDRILEVLANNPEGMVGGAIAQELSAERTRVETELQQLLDANTIQRSDNRYRLV